MERSGFFNSVNGDRRYDASRFAEYFATFISDGVFPNPSTNLQVFANDSMVITVKAGKAWIKGYYYINDGDMNFTLAPADGVLKRIDRVVLRADFVNRTINLAVKKGAFSSNPVAPALERTADIYELGLADVFVGAGVGVITQANITDLRLNNNLCGISHALVEQVDTTTIFNQYKSWYEQYIAGAQAEFDAWFQSVQDILDENTAMQLQSQIDSLSSS
ncbi:MAG TPA: hypothetical protein PKI14_14405, partial [Fervidobacterium sp.]|nr:hypothetical protein [Fervidobacterium sp.]